MAIEISIAGVPAIDHKSVSSVVGSILCEIFFVIISALYLAAAVMLAAAFVLWLLLALIPTFEAPFEILPVLASVAITLFVLYVVVTRLFSVFRSNRTRGAQGAALYGASPREVYGKLNRFLPYKGIAHWVTNFLGVANILVCIGLSVIRLLLPGMQIQNGQYLYIDGIVRISAYIFYINGIRLVAARDASLSNILKLILLTIPVCFPAYIPEVLEYIDATPRTELIFYCVFIASMILLPLYMRRSEKLRLALATARDAERARKSDKRRPIVLLRSFQDDAAQVDLTPEVLAQSVPERTADEVERALKGVDIRIEDDIHTVARHYGPVIAVGEPGKLPRSGAARAYYRGEDWRKAVESWMDEALCIIVIAGLTEGVRWELKTAIQRGHARRLILFFPRDEHHSARWAWAETNLVESGVSAQMQGVDSKDVIALHLDASGRLVVLRAPFAGPSAYGTAFAIALYGMFLVGGDEGKDTAGARSEPA